MEREDLFKFFSGETSYEEEVKIKSWIEESEENKMKAIKERHIFDSIILLAGNSTGKHCKGGRLISISKVCIRVAAAVIIMLGISLTVKYVYDKEAAVPMLSFYVPQGQRINMTLPDGTNVWLNSNTEINYPSCFLGDNRIVSISGEAFLDVKRDERHPFIVNTERCSIKVLGTKFNVSSYSDEKYDEVALMEGKVEVALAGKEHSSLMLFPGTKVVLTDEEIMKKKIDDYDQYRWKDGLICFNDEPFDDIMDKLNRVYGVDIKVRNSNVMKLKYTGKFRYSDGIDYALRVMKMNIGFDYSYDENMDVIYIK